MYDVSELRKGLKVEIDGVPYMITEFSFMKPGKGQAVYSCKMKSLLNGVTTVRNYRSGDKVDQPQMEHKKLQFSYMDGDSYVFIDSNYEQVSLSKEVLGTARFFMKEDLPIEVMYHNGRPIEVSLPTFIERAVISTEPGARGNTATNVFKPATLEGGYEMQVPLFINVGDVLVIDTRTGEYSERVGKK
ncbi:MAG: elongation factor P [Lentisphaerae bacterium RIFOXYC12_FULL_60_16]|nr:MAG: elongation factor P [Lentisphaerae bacterium RIFOXYC12_FULL_60_16]